MIHVLHSIGWAIVSLLYCMFAFGLALRDTGTDRQTKGALVISCFVALAVFLLTL